MNVLKALQKPAAVAVVVGLLLMLYPKLALAGGSMGGSCFSSDSDWSSDDEGGVSVSSERSSSAGVGSFMFFVALVLLSGLAKSSENSVLKLQVGLFGLKRSLQEDLNRIAETADMSTREGLHYVLTETVKALLRHPHYCISTCSSVDVKYGKEETEKRFNQLSIEERGKFDEETLVNINNIKKRSSTIPKASGSSNEYMVITILVAAKGGYKLASIDNIKDLTKVLQELASIPSSETLAVHVIWTPQKEDETLSEQELLEDYPLLRPFQEMKTD